MYLVINVHINVKFSFLNSKTVVFKKCKVETFPHLFSLYYNHSTAVIKHFTTAFYKCAATQENRTTRVPAMSDTNQSVQSRREEG